MKRTLHLTVMMLLAIIASVNRAYGQEDEREVLYETDFSNNELSRWTHSSQWTYLPESNCLHGSVTATKKIKRDAILLYKTIYTGGKYYKDIEVTYDISTSFPSVGLSDCYASISSNYAGENHSLTDTIFKYDIPRQNFQICIQLDVTNNTGNPNVAVTASVDIRKLKITGVLFSEDYQPDYEISDMSQFPNLPEMSIVKVNFEDATVLTRESGNVILLDKNKGGIVINDSIGLQDIACNEEGWMNRPYVISGYVTGVLLTRNGSPELYCPVYKTKLSDNQTPQLYGREIDYDDYPNHIGELVSIPSLSDIDLWDRSGWMEDVDYISRTEQSRNDRNYKVSGVVFPYKNGGNLRVIELPNFGSYYGLNEKYDNNYQNLNGISVQYPRLFEKDKWYTLCLPFDLVVAENKGVFAKYEGGHDGILSFRKESIDTLYAGTPVMYKPESDITKALSGVIKIDNGNPVYETHGDFSFVGLLNPGEAESGSYYLAAGNTIKPFIPGSLMKAFHAYFVPNTPSAARARAISIDGMTTAIEDIEWGDGNPFLAPTDSRIYNLEGQMVGNDLNHLPKGMYIVNGKKVIK